MEYAVVPPVPGRRLDYRDRRLWAFLARCFLGRLPPGFVIYGTPIFLSRAWHNRQSGISAVVWIPPFGRGIG